LSSEKKLFRKKSKEIDESGLEKTKVKKVIKETNKRG